MSGGSATSAEAPITIAEIGEFALIAAIERRISRSPGVIIGIGDDAAVLRAADGRVVAATDMLIEGRHFRSDWSSARDIGRKAAARNLADIAAMGALPTALLVSFAGPGELEVAWVLELVDGIAQEAAAAGAGVAGGDTSSADVVTLAVTALGDLAGREPVTRRGARPGDVVAIAGTMGAAAAGLALLSRGLTAPGSDLSALIVAHQRPEPPYDAGPEAAALGATSMIDVSDGLVSDLGHVAEGSGVRIELSSALTAAEPAARTGELARAAALLGKADWTEWVLAGGDDHALAATFPPGVTLPARWTIIGRVTRGHGIIVDGRTWDNAGGWEHFRTQLRIVANAILNVTRRDDHLLDITTLMPRHRLEDPPRYRTKRQGFWPGRSVRSLAAQVRLAGDGAGARVPAITRRAKHSAGLWRRAEYGRIVRGAMLTPWFAVSVGIVVATSLTLTAPHPALTFPAPKTGRCVHCGAATRQATGHNPMSKHVNPLTAGPAGGRRAAAVEVKYAEQPMHKGQFMALIVIIGHHALKNWTLRFSLPGADVDTIMWAKWRPDGTDGIIIRGSPLPWRQSGASEARIVIAGTGTPGAPTDCFFDSAPCRFRAVTDETPKHGRWPFGRKDTSSPHAGS